MIRRLSTPLVVAGLILQSLGPSREAAAQPASLEQLFVAPPDDSRIMMRWWWFGPAVAKPELERELRVMRDAGIGGVEVQPVYPLSLDSVEKGIRNLPYLSDEFIDALRFAADKARELGMRLDVTVGSGWPYGGPSVSIDQAAGRLRYERVNVDRVTGGARLPSLSGGETQIARFNSEGSDEVLFVIASRTGMMVKRPAVGAEGFVLDHYDRAAVDRYTRNVGDRLLQAFGASPPYAVFCDSLEVYDSDWTGDFLDEFQRRRGYDLRLHLPVLLGVPPDNLPATMALRHDWGKTLSELLEERFVVPMQQWARRNGTRFRIQAYGTPPATLSSNAAADLPEGEGWQWKILRASRWASSASHLFGRAVTSSETWTWLHSPVFRATPLDIKAEADRHFLQGINQLIGHGWPYTPPGAEYPGWSFYAAAALDERNPWWMVMTDVARYLQRVSFMLRQGEPANDVALYLPTTDAWAHFTPGHVNLIETLRDLLGPDVVARVLDAGFDLDFFDDGALARAGKVEGGTLAFGKSRYRVVILPGVERIPLETLRKLDAFVTSGGLLVATRRLPSMAPGFLATESDHRQVREIVHRLFQSASAPAPFVERESDLDDQLRRTLRPDVALTPMAGDVAAEAATADAREIGFVHRRTEAADIYFLANTSNRPQHVSAAFRVDRAAAESWDPMNGRIGRIEADAAKDGRVTLRLNFEPYGSRIVVFRGSATSRSLPASGSSRRAPGRLEEASLDLSSGWRLTFDSEPGQSRANRVLESLRSWTADEETRFYSGVGAYEKRVRVPDAILKPGLDVMLELGEGRPLPTEQSGPGMQAWLESPVREAAIVYVNGQRAGSVWSPPYHVEVTDLLKPGDNDFRIVVGNLAVNKMAGRAQPVYRLLNLRYGVRFEPQDLDKIRPEPAGLLGPIRLRAGAAPAQK